jgi:hypothetical protein
MKSISSKSFNWPGKSQKSTNEPPSTISELFESWMPKDADKYSEIPSPRRLTNKQRPSWPAARFSNISILNYYLEEIRDELERANSYYSPKESTKRIEEIWAKLDELSSIAESKLRMKILAAGKPKLSKDFPSDVCTKLENLKTAPEAATPALQVTDLVSKLLRALPLELLSTLNIDIRWLGIGTLEVKLNDHLTWLVYPVRIPWPAVKVKTIASDSLSNSADINTFFTAQSVIHYSLDKLI